MHSEVSFQSQKIIYKIFIYRNHFKGIQKTEHKTSLWPAENLVVPVYPTNASVWHPLKYSNAEISLSRFQSIPCDRSCISPHHWEGSNRFSRKKMKLNPELKQQIGREVKACRNSLTGRTLGCCASDVSVGAFPEHLSCSLDAEGGCGPP